jgi:hypothetical protein
MSPLLALSLSIAVLGGIWAYLALSPLAGFVLVWAGFIAWGCYFHSGGGIKALVKTLCGNVYGIVIGWIALLIIFKTGVADMGPGAIASVVGVTVFLLVIVASIEPLSAVPANVYGYASIVAYALHQASAPGPTPDVPGTGPLQNLTAANFENPLTILIVSMVIGALAGYLSGQLAKVMTRKV